MKIQVWSIAFENKLFLLHWGLQVVLVGGLSCAFTVTSSEYKKNHSSHLFVHAVKVILFLKCLQCERYSNNIMGKLRCDIFSPLICIEKSYAES